MLNHLLLDSDRGSPERYHVSLRSGGGHRGVQEAQPKMPVAFGLWHTQGGAFKLCGIEGAQPRAGREEEGIVLSGFGKGFCGGTCCPGSCRRSAQDHSQRSILDTV